MHRTERQPHPAFWFSLGLLTMAAFWLLLLEAEGRSTLIAGPSPPLFSQPGGHYTTDILLEIRPPAGQPEAGLLLTLDGREPLPASASRYSRPLTLLADPQSVTVVRARTLSADGSLGPVATATYFMGIPVELPLLSVVADPADLWDAEHGIYENPEQRGRAWERPAHLTYWDGHRAAGFEAPAGLRIHGHFSRGYAKKSFRLYFRASYGQDQLLYPLFNESLATSYQQLVLHAGGQDSTQILTNWTLIRNQVAAELARSTGALSTRSQPVLLFLNGQPWGLYYLRERIDEDFLTGTVGASAPAILDTPARRQENPEENGPAHAHWDALTAFASDRDLREPENYRYVQARVEFTNFIDYTLLQLFSANFDWPFTNIQQFQSQTQGGRWQWFIWDSDLSFGLRPWSEVNMDTLAQGLNPAYSAGTGIKTDGRDTVLLRALLENEDFRARFLNRAANLLNTTLSPATVIQTIRVQAGAIRPGLVFENQRWDGDGAEWEQHVGQMEAFARQRPDIVWRQLIDHLHPAGTGLVTIEAPEAARGRVLVDETPITSLPWQGRYFVGNEIRLTAVPAPGYQFDGWEVGARILENPLIVRVQTERHIRPIFVVADSQAISPGDIAIAGIEMEGLSIGGIRLLVRRRGGLDLRGWRLTDNDRKTALDEGSLIFREHPAWARVPAGTEIRILLPSRARNEADQADDLDAGDGLMRLQLPATALDEGIDPWFRPAPGDNLVLLAPGDTAEFSDDQAIDWIIIERPGLDEAWSNSLERRRNDLLVAFQIEGDQISRDIEGNNE